MTTPKNDLIPIPNFTAYAMSPSGDVYRIRSAPRGRSAGLQKPKWIAPVCHPRGTAWYVQLTSDRGTRHRINTKRLREMVNSLEVLTLPND